MKDRRYEYATIAVISALAIYILLPVVIPAKKANLKRYTKGLVNTGNDCFANSTFQALSSLDVLHKWLNQTKSLEYSQWITTINEFLTVLAPEDLKSPEPVSVWPVIRVMEALYGMRMSRSQQDAHEMLVYILQLIETEVKRSNGDLIDQLPFRGIQTDRIVCLKCKREKKIETPFFVLEIQPEDSILKKNTDFISDYRCEFCNQLTTIEKSNLISRLPSVLCVHINRDSYAGMAFRNNTAASVPAILPSGHQLKAVIFHKGSHYRGHYTCSRRQRTGEKWWLISDDSISETSESRVLNRVSEIYMLFYEKS